MQVVVSCSALANMHYAISQSTLWLLMYKETCLCSEMKGRHKQMAAFRLKAKCLRVCINTECLLLSS